ncbi:MAG TPA: FHA domain-containing protein, partial [Kofleriaceae bacterium]|nr:FHA domain-containing protein [Kofleriaceae bacterium]
MFSITVTEKGGEQRRMEFDKPEVTIGRVQGNDVVLPKGNVSKRHARIVLKDGKFIIVDLKSTNGTYVNGRKIASPLVVKDTDKIYIGDFILGVEEPGRAGAGFDSVNDIPAPPPEPPAPPPPMRMAPEPPPPPAPLPMRPPEPVRPPPEPPAPPPRREPPPAPRPTAPPTMAPSAPPMIAPATGSCATACCAGVSAA